MKSFKYSLIVTIVGVLLAGLLTLVTSLWLDARQQKMELSHENAVLITENECWKDELGKEHTRTYQYSIQRETLLNSKDSAIKQNKILQNIAEYYKNLPRTDQRRTGMLLGMAMNTTGNIRTETPNKISDAIGDSAAYPIFVPLNDPYFQGSLAIYSDTAVFDYYISDSLTGSLNNKTRAKFQLLHPFKKRPTYYRADMQLSNPKAHISGQTILEVK